MIWFFLIALKISRQGKGRRQPEPVRSGITGTHKDKQHRNHEEEELKDNLHDQTHPEFPLQIFLRLVIFRANHS